LVLIWAFQNLVAAPGSMSVLALVSMLVKRPMPMGVVVTSGEGGVATAGTTTSAVAITRATTAAVAATTRLR
jgi:hypothetical protein